MLGPYIRVSDTKSVYKIISQTSINDSFEAWTAPTITNAQTDHRSNTVDSSDVLHLPVSCRNVT